jgi:Leucine carboxyl methyltransferase
MPITDFDQTHFGTKEVRPMPDEEAAAADGSAVRVALWRALHVQFDPPPHVLEDEIDLQLAAPDDGWRNRPDMDPAGTSSFRAGIVPRARLVEDLVAEQSGRGVTQYVSAATLNQRYFAGRTDGLRTLRGEELLVATT